MRKSLVLFALTAVSLLADVSGKWTGTIRLATPDDNGESEKTAYLVLKEADGKITGTAGPDASEQFTISEGKAEGGRVTFQIAEHGMTFDLKENGDELTGNVLRERDGQTQKATLKVKRDK